MLGVVVFHDHVLLKYQSGILFANCSVEGCIFNLKTPIISPGLISESTVTVALYGIRYGTVL